MRAALGIDPGASGAAALITEEREVIIARFKYETVESLANFFWDIANLYESSCAFEAVSSFKSDGKATAFTFGRNTGNIEGMLWQAGIPITDYVEPKTWQYVFNLGGKWGPKGCTRSIESTARKNAHKAKAQEIFPDISMTLDQCDALLIGEYQWLKMFCPSSLSSGVKAPSRKK